jgi:hypothetical protein
MAPPWLGGLDGWLKPEDLYRAAALVVENRSTQGV